MAESKNFLNGVLIFPIEKQKDRLYLENILKENIFLVKNLNIHVINVFSFTLKAISPKTYIKRGKLEEIKKFCQDNDIDIIIFLNPLSPSQKLNLENYFEPLNVYIMDREAVIINIFKQNARTKFAKLQSELAYLKYILPRLKGQYDFSRTGGGIGTRGPGEQKLELDRRYIQKRISYIIKQLAKRKQHFKIQSHKRKSLFTVAICGYTNSGKTTLLNKITNAKAKILKRPFTTLDILAKRRWLEGENIIFIDTIGFIRDLPNSLWEAFKSTLEIINSASLIIKLFDLSSPNIDEEIKIVNSILSSVLEKDINSIEVFNKIDKNLAKQRLPIYKKLYPDAFFISAKNSINLENLINFLKKEKEFVKYKL